MNNGPCYESGLTQLWGVPLLHCYDEILEPELFIKDKYIFIQVLGAGKTEMKPPAAKEELLAITMWCKASFG